MQSARDATEARALAEGATAIVIGPAAGVTQRTREMTLELASLGAPMVLDADALTVFAQEPDALFEALHAACVATPHIGEFRRLFPDIGDSAMLKIDRACAAAKRAGCVILLKGPDTVIAAPDGRAAVNTTGTPFLATAAIRVGPSRTTQ